MRLNVGCGDRHATGDWVNCDSWAGIGPDVVMDCTAGWPFPDASAEAVYLGQVLEHLDGTREVTAALREASRCLVGGGRLVAVTPDWDREGSPGMGPEIWANLRRGERRWPGDTHRWWPTRHHLLATVRTVFAQAVLAHPGTIGAGWPDGNRDPWDIAVIAVK